MVDGDHVSVVRRQLFSVVLWETAKTEEFRRLYRDWEEVFPLRPLWLEGVMENEVGVPEFTSGSGAISF